MAHAATAWTARKKRRNKTKAKTSRLRKPEGMSLEEWQIALRREFGRQQRFKLQNIGGQEIFSEFDVSNPATWRTYRVTIRGRNPGDNYCSCPDYIINTLGTCKHIEFTLGRLERRPGGKAALKQGFHPPYSEIVLRYGARREVIFRPAGDCPAAVLRIVREHFDPQNVLLEKAFAKFEELLKQIYAAGHELRCYDDAMAFIAQMRDRATLVQRVNNDFPDDINSAAFEALLKVPLYEYQRRGALFTARAGRALIADDMGLGKTIQAIAATEILKRAAGVERVLIVCPTSLKYQWKEEIAKFAGRTSQVIHGMTSARAAQYQQPPFIKIVNYDVIHRDLPAIRQWAPDLIILDEAQRIKNWKTRTAQSVKQLPSQYAIVLTGTPLENRLEELHSIVEFVDRFRLGPSFKFLSEHQTVDEDGRVVGYHNLNSIARTLEPILIRRTKSEVLKQLPERLEKHLFIPMTPQQRQFHEENAEIVARIVAKWRRYKFLTEADQRRLTVSLQNMRMCCNSTYLLDQQTDFGNKVNEFDSQLNELLEQPDMKVVVFSQWLRTHELLLRRLQRRGRNFVLFHGGVPGPQRKDLVIRFKEDEKCRVFLSTDAGGVGLNLQRASAVMNMDQPWNPAVLEQRIGRVHRLGQSRPVHVVHFVAENTIEHSMLNTLKFKRSLFAGVLDSGDSDIFLGGSRLNKFMESVEQVTTPLSQPIETTATPSSSVESVPISDPPSSTALPPSSSLEAQSLTSLINAGRQFLDQLGAAISSSADASGSPLIEHDKVTGRSYLKLPMPSPQMMEKLTSILGMFAAAP